MTDQVQLKTKAEIEIMAQGGKRLGRVKTQVKKAVRAGISAAQIEDLATALIQKEGGSPSFKMVPGYHWSTCINVNDGVVHGIPKKELVFRQGDIVSVDLGLFYHGFHSDTSFSVLIGKDKEKQQFLDVGQEALKKAIAQARVGKRLGDISAAIEETITAAGYAPVRALVGHGIGRELHEYPPVACFLSGNKVEKMKLVAGMVLAIEVMYAAGKSGLKLDADGWTIRTKDAKIAGLFEETVSLNAHGPVVLSQ